MTSTWWNRLKSGLKRSSTEVGEQLKAALFHRKVDAQTLDDIEDILIQADMGVETAAQIRSHLNSLKLSPATAGEDVMEHLQQYIENKLEPVTKTLELHKNKLQIVLMVGVNGAGKTTTIGKLAWQWAKAGYTVELAACDTFRAAATEQLKIWADRVGVPVYTANQGSDPSALVFDAIKKAQENKVDVLVVDTAGRLQNKAHLMDELQKILRVIKKIIPDAPHHTILILDATTGQNAISQTEIFSKSCSLTGLIVTKLDGTAKGGMVVALADRFALPIYAIGVGESVDDLQPFTAKQFATALLGEHIE